jgi:hypothetical protein
MLLVSLKTSPFGGGRFTKLKSWAVDFEDDGVKEASWAYSASTLSFASTSMSSASWCCPSVSLIHTKHVPYPQEDT